MLYFCYNQAMGLISVLRKKNKKLLFTTPSHSGKKAIYHKFYNWYKSDISEVDAYNPEDALKEAQTKAALIYGTKKTYFLINGSTSGILASVLACCNRGDNLLIWSKAHPCHKNAGTLSGANIIEYELDYNSDWGIYENITPQRVLELINKYSPKTIIITSPTYEGMCADVIKIAQICKENGVYLIVDEAHGALYPFSDNLPRSAVNYADFTVQSLHKTAGGINPTALLHTNTELDVEKALRLINTTSPSYPMLATIEANINYLNSSKGRKEIESLILRITNIRKKLTNLEFYGDDITKILIKKQGLSGFELSEILYEKFNIEDEKTNSVSTMLLTGIGTSDRKLTKLNHLIKL